MQDSHSIADNLNAMDLGSKTGNAVNKWSQQPQSCPQQQQQKTSKPQNQHACESCTKSHAPSRASCLPRTPHADLVAKLVIGMSDTGNTSSRQKDPNKKPPRHGTSGEKQKQTHTVDIGNNYDPKCDEVHVNTTAINIDALTETWATVTMPVEIGPNHCGNL